MDEHERPLAAFAVPFCTLTRSIDGSIKQHTQRCIETLHRPNRRLKYSQPASVATCWISNRSRVAELIYTVNVATLAGWLYFRRRCGRCSISIHTYTEILTQLNICIQKLVTLKVTWITCTSHCYHHHFFLHFLVLYHFSVVCCITVRIKFHILDQFIFGWSKV